jgi:hypothetical protein
MGILDLGMNCYGLNTMNKLVSIAPKEFLQEIGINRALIASFNNTDLTMLVAIAMDNAKKGSDELKKLITTLFAMELKGKKGAIYLVFHHLANISQLRNLKAEEIAYLFEEHSLNKEDSIIKKKVKEFLVVHQQESLYMKSGGVKGEYYIDHLRNKFPN